MGVYLTSADDVVKGNRGSGDRRGYWSVRYRQRQGEEGGRRGWRDEWVSGGGKIGWPKRPVADRGRLTACWGKRSFRVPHHLSPIALIRTSKKTQNVRDEIQQGCGNYTVPSQGWSHPALAGRSTLRAHSRFFLVFFLGLPILISPHPNPQFYSYYKQGVCCKAQSQVI